MNLCSLKRKAGQVLFCASILETHMTEWTDREGGGAAGGWLRVKKGVKPHLPLPQILHAPHQSQIETHAKAVLEEERGAAAVQLPFGDDGDAVAQQVGLIHVVGGQDHRAAWTDGNGGGGETFLNETLYAESKRNFSVLIVKKKTRLSSAFVNRFWTTLILWWHSFCFCCNCTAEFFRLIISAT